MSRDGVFYTENPHFGGWGSGGGRRINPFATFSTRGAYKEAKQRFREYCAGCTLGNFVLIFTAIALSVVVCLAGLMAPPKEVIYRNMRVMSPEYNFEVAGPATTLGLGLQRQVVVGSNNNVKIGGGALPPLPVLPPPVPANIVPPVANNFDPVRCSTTGWFGYGSGCGINKLAIPRNAMGTFAQFNDLLRINKVLVNAASCDAICIPNAAYSGVCACRR